LNSSKREPKLNYNLLFSLLEAQEAKFQFTRARRTLRGLTNQTYLLAKAFHEREGHIHTSTSIAHGIRETSLKIHFNISDVVVGSRYMIPDGEQYIDFISGVGTDILEDEKSIPARVEGSMDGISEFSVKSIVGFWNSITAYKGIC